MYKALVIDYYNNNQAELARVLGIKNRQNIQAWGEIIPREYAYDLADITKDDDDPLIYEAVLYKKVD